MYRYVRRPIRLWGRKPGDLRCSFCGRLPHSLGFSNKSVFGRGGGRAVYICDVCVADLYRQAVLNFGPGWPNEWPDGPRH